MYVAVHNLSSANGDLITSGTKDLKPEQLGDKETVERYVELGAIRKMTAEDKEAAEDSVIVTGEVTDKQTEKAKDKATK